MANNEITSLSFTTKECRSASSMKSKLWFCIAEKQYYTTHNSRISEYIIVNKRWISGIFRGLFGNNLSIYFQETTDLSIECYQNDIKHWWNKEVS